jgi:D-tyrosyl-tRNA(Tyr) deacylase
VIGLLQRVTHAAVRVDGAVIGAIDVGLLVLVGVERGDNKRTTERLLTRLLGYRVFADNDDKMNRSLTDVDGGLLLVPQFTLPADTRKGTRPSFTPAAPPDEGERLFNHMITQAVAQHPHVATGRFGANMQVELTNDGPVTLWLRVDPPSDQRAPLTAAGATHEQVQQ